MKVKITKHNYLISTDYSDYGDGRSHILNKLFDLECLLMQLIIHCTFK